MLGYLGFTFLAPPLQSNDILTLSEQAGGGDLQWVTSGGYFAGKGMYVPETTTLQPAPSPDAPDSVYYAPLRNLDGSLTFTQMAGNEAPLPFGIQAPGNAAPVYIPPTTLPVGSPLTSGAQTMSLIDVNTQQATPDDLLSNSYPQQATPDILLETVPSSGANALQNALQILNSAGSTLQQRTQAQAVVSQNNKSLLVLGLIAAFIFLKR